MGPRARRSNGACPWRVVASKRHRACSPHLDRCFRQAYNGGAQVQWASGHYGSQHQLTHHTTGTHNPHAHCHLQRRVARRPVTLTPTLTTETLQAPSLTRAPARRGAPPPRTLSWPEALTCLPRPDQSAPQRERTASRRSEGRGGKTAFCHARGLFESGTETDHCVSRPAQAAV